MTLFPKSASTGGEFARTTADISALVGTQTWNDGIWRANGNSNVSWKDGSKATFTSSGKADVSIEGSVNVSGLVFENYSKAHSIQGGTLNTGANATIEKRGDFGAVISSAIPVYHGRQDVPNTSDPRLAICVSGQRAITSNLHGGLAAGYTYSGTNVVYWRNRRLSDISGFASADFHRNTGSKCLGAKPFFYENNGTTASVQFQYKASDPWTYASKVTFTQRGDDILAKIDYWRARKIPYGEDMSPSTPQTQYGEENIGGQKVWDDVSTSSGGNWTVSYCEGKTCKCWRSAVLMQDLSSYDVEMGGAKGNCCPLSLCRVSL